MSEGKEIALSPSQRKADTEAHRKKYPNVRNVIVTSQGILVHSQIAVTNPAILMRKQDGGGVGFIGS